MLQVHDNRMRLVYTQRLPVTFVCEATLLQVRPHQC